MNVKRRATVIVCVTLLLIVLFPTVALAQAGGFGSTLEIEELRVDGVINNGYAITTISETFTNTADFAQNADFMVTIPEGAFISNFTITMGDKEFYGEVAPKEEAQEEYDEAVEKGQSAGLVSSSGENTFGYQISVAAGKTLTMSLRYEEFLVKRSWRYNYMVHLSKCSFGSNIKSYSFSVDIRSHGEISDIEQFGISGTVNDEDTYRASVSHTSTDVTTFGDVNIRYRTSTLPKSGNMLFYNGYFLHSFCPALSDVGGSPLDKKIVFVLDKSGSMNTGNKMFSMQSAFTEIINQLRPTDMFNMVAFSNDVDEFKTSFIIANDSNKADAVTYTNALYPEGSTDIDGALSAGLGNFMGTDSYAPIMVFLTDGVPTAGETNEQSIRKNIISQNTAGVSIFSLGFGDDVEFAFLDALSLENSGDAYMIEEGTSAAEQLTDFFDTIATPVLWDIAFEYNGIDVYPLHVEQLFEGSEIAVVGRVKDDSTSVSTTVVGMSAQGSETFSENFAVKADDPDNAFVERFWAYYHIDKLLDDIVVKGEDPALVEEITELSVEHSFVTPYTSLVITIEEDPDSTEGEAEAEAEAEAEGEGDDTTDDDDPYTPGDDDDDDDESDGGGWIPEYPVFLVAPMILLALVILVRRRIENDEA